MCQLRSDRPEAYPLLDFTQRDNDLAIQNSIKSDCYHLWRRCNAVLFTNRASLFSSNFKIHFQKVRIAIDPARRTSLSYRSRSDELRHPNDKKAFGHKKSDLYFTKIFGSTALDLRSVSVIFSFTRRRITPRHQHKDVLLPGWKQVGSCRRCTRMLPLPARNIAPGNVALVLSPPRTRSLPGAFFAPTLGFLGRFCWRPSCVMETSSKSIDM